MLFESLLFGLYVCPRFRRIRRHNEVVIGKRICSLSSLLASAVNVVSRRQRSTNQPQSSWQESISCTLLIPNYSLSQRCLFPTCQWIPRPQSLNMQRKGPFSKRSPWITTGDCHFQTKRTENTGFCRKVFNGRNLCTRCTRPGKIDPRAWSCTRESL